MGSEVTRGATLGYTPTFTPLLASGSELTWTDRREVEFADGTSATVARCAILRPSAIVAGLTLGFSDGPKTEFQVLTTQVPETIGFVPDLICHPRTTIGVGPSMEGAVSERLARRLSGLGVEYQPVPISHRDLRRRYSLKADADVGANWLTQLFSPKFLDWLANHPPKGFGFELTHGWLVSFVALDMNWLGSDFDQITSSSEAVANALRTEALEERGLDFAGSSSRSDRGEGELRTRMRRFAEGVEWRSPLDSQPAAKRRFLRRLAMRPRVILAALVLSAPMIGLAFVSFSGSARWWGGAGAAVFIAGFIAYELSKRRADQLGLFAFIDRYSRERGFERLDPRLFQARHLGLNLTAVVEEALAGVQVGDRTGTLVLMQGTGHDTGVRYQAMIVPIGDDVDEDIVVTEHGPSGQFIADGHLVSWMVVAPGEPTTESLDRFIEQTAELYPTLLRG